MKQGNHDLVIIFNGNPTEYEWNFVEYLQVNT